jgi:hypothetical protein
VRLTVGEPEQYAHPLFKGVWGIKNLRINSNRLVYTG